jgi:hypothetical protein
LKARAAIKDHLDNTVNYLHVFNTSLEKHLERPFSAKNVDTLQLEHKIRPHLTKAEIRASELEDRNLDKLAKQA